MSDMKETTKAQREAAVRRPNAVDWDLVLTYGTACGLPDGEGVVAAREALLAHLAELRAEIARVEGEADHDTRAAFAAGARLAEAVRSIWQDTDGGDMRAIGYALGAWDALGVKTPATEDEARPVRCKLGGCGAYAHGDFDKFCHACGTPMPSRGIDVHG